MSKLIPNYKTLMTLEPCEDASTKCARFVPKYCTINKKVMENCKASCGICSKFKIILLSFS